MDDKDQFILSTISMKTPRAMQSVRERFDEGIVMENGLIRMDFNKLFGSDDGETNDREHQMTLFKALEKSHFQGFIEHPLCQAFIGFRFKRAKKYFWMQYIIPSILYAGKYLAKAFQFIEFQF